MQVIVRFNSQKVVRMLQPFGAKMTYERRWQVSHLEGDNYHDAYFVCRPTRKQIRDCRRQAKRKFSGNPA